MDCGFCRNVGVRVATINGGPAFVICGACDAGRRIARALPFLVRWFEGMPMMPPDPKTEPMKTHAHDDKGSYADALDDALSLFLRANPPGTLTPLREAWEAWRGARNASANLRASLYTGGVPDPKKIARFLLDTLAGGALSSLICQVRDDLTPRGGTIQIVRATNESVSANLRALGEEIE